ncbi:matrix protein [Chelidonium yellow mottle associated virus]
MTTYWICASVLTKHAEIEFANRRSPASFKAGAVREAFIDLLGQLSKTGSDKHKILKGLLDLNRVSSIKDMHTSSFFGQRTCRIQYMFSEMNVFPVERKLEEGKTTLCSCGLTAVLEGTKVRANVCVDLVITSIDPDKIECLLSESPEWFCGEIEDLNLDDKTTNKVVKA